VKEKRKRQAGSEAVWVRGGGEREAGEETERRATEVRVQCVKICRQGEAQGARACRGARRKRRGSAERSARGRGAERAEEAMWRQ